MGCSFSICKNIERREALKPPTDRQKWSQRAGLRREAVRTFACVSVPCGARSSRCPVACGSDSNSADTFGDCHRDTGGRLDPRGGPTHDSPCACDRRRVRGCFLHVAHPVCRRLGSSRASPGRPSARVSSRIDSGAFVSSPRQPAFTFTRNITAETRFSTQRWTSG
jgi:hypothetical protein